MSGENIGIGILGTAAIARKNIRAIKLARNGLGEPLSRLPYHAIVWTICASAGSPLVHWAKKVLCKAHGPQAAAVIASENTEGLEQALVCTFEMLQAKDLRTGVQT